MPLPKNLESYSHIQLVLDAVLGRPGATYRCVSPKAATRWRLEAYYFRKLCREQGDNRYNDLVLRVSGDTVSFGRREADGELLDVKGEPISLAEVRPLTTEEFDLEKAVFELAGRLDLEVPDDD